MQGSRSCGRKKAATSRRDEGQLPIDARHAIEVVWDVRVWVLEKCLVVHGASNELENVTLDATLVLRSASRCSKTFEPANNAGDVHRAST